MDIIHIVHTGHIIVVMVDTLLLTHLTTNLIIDIINLISIPTLTDIEQIAHEVVIHEVLAIGI